ncbi:hypothetical protein GSI_05046 [Ganoderma sinense ZZ0214-1]|uniref:Transporter n=1 Tax=Ganoderma sinense ZZ0214-1 TaxID=1077348 RepID=A0A2G8SH79_9APHY|nr:hypothetical protein GSI_05046 [Ganoderma sinense ZZ0214-1]
MFMLRFTAFYGLVFIAATEAFPGMIPNFVREDAPISDSKPIQLSSGNGEVATSLLAHTPSSTVLLDTSATPPVASLPPPATTVRPSVPGESATVSTFGIPTMTHGAAQTVQRRETVTESPGRVVSVAPRGTFLMT